jgi:hypothetical protein
VKRRKIAQKTVGKTRKIIDLYIEKEEPNEQKLEKNRIEFGEVISRRETNAEDVD